MPETLAGKAPGGVDFLLCMVAERTSPTRGPARNKTLVAAVTVLAVVGAVELTLAAIALTPRLFAQARSVSAPNTPPPATSLSEGSPSSFQPNAIVPPLATPLERSPVKEVLATPERGENPFRKSASDSPLQAGNALGIVNIRMEGAGDGGGRKLFITIKSRPKEPIDVPQVKVQVYFYDEEGGEITPSKAQVTSNWLSTPVDWKDGEPELLEVRYLPDTPDTEIRFAGYVVAVYYKGDLQDYRAEPGKLTKLFPLRYFIGLEES